MLKSRSGKFADEYNSNCLHSRFLKGSSTAPPFVNVDLSVIWIAIPDLSSVEIKIDQKQYECLLEHCIYANDILLCAADCKQR